MRKVLYYLMLLFFFACTIWNAISKRDSIMGTEPAANHNQTELVRMGFLHQGASLPEELRIPLAGPTRTATN